MTASHASDSFPSGSPRAVDVASLERELVQAWKSTARSEENAVIRASLINLIVYAHPGAGEVEAAKMVAAVSADLPCRAIVVVEKARSNPEDPAVQGWISAHCQPASPGRKQVCCEQITIRAAPEAEASLPSTILSLLIPDLTTAVWWPGDAELEGPLLERLQGAIDRLVVDSAGFSDPGPRLRVLNDWTDRLRVGDLNWARLDPWRELVAASFDAEPFQDQLQDIRELRVRYPKEGLATAALFAGWLASRLGWQPETAKSGILSMNSAHGNVRLVLEPGATTAIDVHPSLECVTLVCSPRSKSKDILEHRFVVEIDPDRPKHLVARIERQGACPIPKHLALESLDVNTELTLLLRRTHRNTAFEEALEMSASLLRTWG